MSHSRMWNSIVRRKSKNSDTPANEAITILPQQQQQQPNSTAPPDGVAVRLRHTFSMGFADRLRSSGGEDPLKQNLFSPESVRKRFSIGKRTSGQLKTSTSSLNSMPSPTDILESPAIYVVTPSGTSQEGFTFPKPVETTDTRCHSHHEDTNSLNSGQKRSKNPIKKNAVKLLLLDFF